MCKWNLKGYSVSYQLICEWKNLCFRMGYVFCVEVTHDNMISLDKPVRQSCTPTGPPVSNPTNLFVSGGLISLKASWEPEIPECDGLVYQVFLNGVAEPLTHLIKHKMSYFTAGQFNVSVWSENTEGRNDLPMPSITHIIDPLTAPEAVENKGDSTPNYTMLTMQQEVESISFNAFPHWNSMVSLETFFGDHNSNVTELMSIFNKTLDLKLPQSTSVTNKVINGSLVAIVEWVNSLETEEFSVLGFTIRVNVM